MIQSVGTFDVQDCDVSTDHTSILVECTFAINSTAPGIVVIQDDQSQYTINRTLQRLQQDSDKGSVNITGLPAGEYSVRVYDQEEDLLNKAQPAYMSLHITDSGGNADSSPTPSPTLSIATRTPYCVCAYLLVTYSLYTATGLSIIAIVIAGCSAAVNIIIIIVAVGFLCLYVYVKKKHGKGNDYLD